MPIDTESVSLIGRTAAENKYLRIGRENKQIIPSLIDFMTDRFYSVILFTYGSAAVPNSYSKLDLKACVQNKRVVRRLFGSFFNFVHE